MPAELSPRRVARRLLELAIVGAVIGVAVLTGPGLGSVRSSLSRASGGWLILGGGLEVVSALSYILIFRAVFCRRMGWRLSYQIGMAEQGANSVLSVSGAGGLALGAWALRRGGMSTQLIARRSVAFFFLTSLANVGTLIVFALLYAVGVLHRDRNPPLTYGFAVAALVATAVVALGLPRLRPRVARADFGSGRIAKAGLVARNSLGQGVRDALLMLRQRPGSMLVGSIGVLAFDLAALGVCFKAFGYSPSTGVLVVGYLIGQLGGNVPIPGGIAGLDAGLIGTFALYHQPLGASSAAVLAYHALVLWIPGLLGTVAFIRLRRSLQREAQPAAICRALAEPLEPARSS
jgi:glycosyltransferase 2 family protein